MKKYDLIVIGGGAAGFAAVMKADEMGSKTLMVNNDAVGLGGTCVNVGCVPSKYLLNISKIVHDSQNSSFHGIRSNVSLDFKKIMEGKDALISELRNEKYEKVLGALKNVELVQGSAKFISKTEIEVGGNIYSASKFIIATGSSTFEPPIKGIDEVDYLTNMKALNLKKLPKSMIIIGGGALGLEFSQIFSRFGTEVHLLEAMKRIVPDAEPELSILLKKYLKEDGIEIMTDAKVIEVSKDRDGVVVNVVFNEKKKILKAEKLLLAVGRKPNSSSLSLEKVNVNLGRKKEIVVNDEMKASDGIWAAGDVTGEPMLETVSAREGMIAANNALSSEKIKMNYTVVPQAVFTDPQLASVGLTDKKANVKGIACDCNTVSMKLVPKARVVNEVKGAIKLVVDKNTEEIEGVHILAASAADLIHEGVVIVKNKMTLNDVVNTLHIFPTLSEGIKLAAQSFKRDVSKMSCCVE